MRIKLAERIEEVSTVQIKEDCLIIDSSIYETGNATTDVIDKLYVKGYADLSGFFRRDC